MRQGSRRASVPNSMFERLGRGTIKQFLKFCVIGGFNTFIDMAVFALLIFWNTHYAFAQLAAYSAGMLNSYILNSTITFRSGGDSGEGKRSRGGTMLRFLLWNLGMLAASLLLLSIATEWVGLNELLGKAIVTALIVVFNFYGSKRWVFAERKSVETGGMS